MEEEQKKKLIKVLTLVGMWGLLFTMVTLAIVLWKYGGVLKADPCSLCKNCLNFSLNGLP